MSRRIYKLPVWRYNGKVVDEEANVDRCVADDEHDHVCWNQTNNAFLFLWLVICLWQNRDDLTGTKQNDHQWSEEAEADHDQDELYVKRAILASFITRPESVRVVLLSENHRSCYYKSPKNEAHGNSYHLPPPPRSGLHGEPHSQVAVDTDGGLGHDADVHVGEVNEHEESTEGGLWQAEVGVVDPEGKEEDEGRVSYSQVEHVDVGVRPGVSLCDEGVQSGSVDEETREEHKSVSQTLEVVYLAAGVCAVHVFLKEVMPLE